MLKFYKTEFTISQHFATALEYGDYGDMDKDEIKEFEEWEHEALLSGGHVKHIKE